MCTHPPTGAKTFNKDLHKARLTWGKYKNAVMDH